MCFGEDLSILPLKMAKLAKLGALCIQSGHRGTHCFIEYVSTIFESLFSESIKCFVALEHHRFENGKFSKIGCTGVYTASSGT